MGNRHAGRLALDQVSGGGDLVSDAAFGDRQHPPVGVDGPPQVIDDLDACGPQCKVDLPGPPRAARGVAEDDTQPEVPARLGLPADRDAAPDLGCDGVGIDGQDQHDRRVGSVGGVDTCGGHDRPGDRLHDARDAPW